MDKNVASSHIGMSFGILTGCLIVATILYGTVKHRQQTAYSSQDYVLQGKETGADTDHEKVVISQGQIV